MQREILHLPEYVFPAAMLVFGYPTMHQQERKKPERSSLEYIVQENTYKAHDRETLQKMLEVKTARQDYREWLQAFCHRKYNSDFAREMSRSVNEYLKQYR